MRLDSNCEADQRLCFHYRDSSNASTYTRHLKILFCGCTDRFVSGLVGNVEDQFLMSHDNDMKVDLSHVGYRSLYVMVFQEKVQKNMMLGQRQLEKKKVGQKIKCQK